ncbi:hypothetical protein GCM10010129_59870 [Streptomyces fumigatiscleroticus]|nr:hypothetical protein GCM10010129_59870 [Streptomyces fumigatiscleroticus]
MTRWKELPASLDDTERQLVAQLRRLKDRGGWSLAALAAKTSYSSSSWERYLNGKKPVPRGAVEELARVSGTAAERLLVLHEVAEAARPERPEPAGETDRPARRPLRGRRPGSAAARTDRPRRVPRAALAGAAAAVLVVFGAGFLAGAAWRQHTGTPDVCGTPPGAAAFSTGATYGCDGVERRAGGLYAGYSTSRDALLDRGSTGWEVVEAQCLLRHHGFDSGRTDGVYGERTGRAARAFQQRRGLVPDGIVGPDTWRELRS